MIKAALCSILMILGVFTVDACASTPRHTAPPRRTAAVLDVGGGATQRGMGTWYGKEHQGRPTASGERFDRHQFTAAHKTLPLGTRVRVTNTKNGQSAVVRINDRGPYGEGRIIDVSEAAARALGMIDSGVAPVTIEVVQ